MPRKILSRRDILRNSAVIGGGLAAGGALTAGTAAASNGGGRGQGGVGYISVSSYQKLIGETAVDCVDGEAGWGDTFYIRREAQTSSGEEGVFIDVPPSCNGNGPDRSFRGYLITAESDTECEGGPSGSGPFVEDCCSWIFVNTNRHIRFGIEQRITNVHGPDPPEPCHETVQPRDDDTDPVGDEFDVVRVTFAPVPEGGRERNGPP
mgnify:CR=1 FL=1